MPNDIDDVDASSRQLSMGVVETLIGFRFRRIQNEMSRRFKLLISRAEVNPGMFSALALIRANPGLSQTELAAQIGMDRATVVALIDALEASGWAKRSRDARDRRKHSLSISPAGSRELARLEELALANEAPVRAALGPKGLADLRRLLDRIDTALAEAEEPQKRPSRK